ncbi:MAG: ACP S-malonyltransferase [Pyrinomonadaceae bacterium MAG19_C2-C3]|nr:ACP S-malonyltransferase [Pyrinomonadaceae bacterium MAG19_C2-C3]
MSIAYIFPGQGSQTIGMGRDLADNFDAAREVFEEADDALGFALSKMCFEGSAANLQLTENTQPALLTVSVAALRAARSEGLPAPQMVAGHSLGEYSALVCAGAIEFQTAVRLVRQRGRYMQEAVPEGVGAMAAVLGADAETVAAACREAEQMEAGKSEVCAPANINSATQIVIAGHAAAVERATLTLREQAAQQGTRIKTIRLPVSAPFHCSLMLPAQARLEKDLHETDFADLQTPLINNVAARVVRTGDEARAGLIEQVSASVRWYESMMELGTQGFRKFVEIGAGKVLSGLVKQIVTGAACYQVETAASLAATLKGLETQQAENGDAA